MPLVSVLLPVYNGAEFLEQAIESILAQTYAKIQVIVVDDGSTDRTSQILQDIVDPRVSVLTNDRNVGLVASLLRGIEACSGDFIARMDADDICLKRRIATQVKFMLKHPEVGVMGGAAVMFGRGVVRIKAHPVADSNIKAEMFLRSSIVHPTVMFRVERIPEWYSAACNHAEDYELWTRLADQNVVFANTRRPLIRYRLHGNRVSETRSTEQSRGALTVRNRNLANLGLGNDSRRASLLESLSVREAIRDVGCQEYGQMIEDILVANRSLGVYDRRAFSKVLLREFGVACSQLDGPKCPDLCEGMFRQFGWPVLSAWCYAWAYSLVRTFVHWLESRE